MIELKPCPFCGGRAELYADDRYGVCVRCSKCFCMTSYQADNNTIRFSFTEYTYTAVDMVIDRWNKRVTDERKD